MKTKLTLLVVLLVVMAFSAQAQSKKDIEAELETCKLSSAKLQIELDGLTASYDSILTAYTVYDTMYTVIKEKVLMNDFDPANMSEIIDSLRTGREEAFSEITTALNDSISLLVEENMQLKEALEGMKGEGDEAMDNLKKLKELLDEEVITQEEFDAKKKEVLEEL